jgi:CRISPR system Cascade subunit CasA
VLDLAANVNTSIESSQQPLLVAGLASDQAKLLRWRSEYLVLPTALLSLPDCAHKLRLQVREAEELFGDLSSEIGRRKTSFSTITAGMIADTLPDSDSKDSKKRARALFNAGSATAVFFAAAERALGQVMNLLAQQDADAAEAVWKQTLRDAAHAAWQAVFDDLGRSARALRAEAKHSPRLFARLRDFRPVIAAPLTTAQEVHP